MKKILTLLFSVVFISAIFAQPCDPITNPCLPVTITDFTARTEGGNVKLEWATASEVNASNFEIERSMDGKQFGHIATIKCENRPTSYSFIDDAPLSIGAYYRLKQVDYDGKATVFRAVFVEHSTSKISIYPNPSTGPVTISSKGTIRVFNLIGQEIQVIDTSADLSLEKGFYIVKSGGEARQLIVR